MAHNNNHPCEQVLKFVIVGDSATGKSSLATRFTSNFFEKQYNQTVGIDFYMKRVVLNGGFRVAIQVWDTGGPTLRSQMIDNYLFGAQAILLLYDITRPDSFDTLEEWIAVVFRVIQSSDTVPHLALVACKCDLEHIRQVYPESHSRFVQQFGTSSHWVSPKTGESVEVCFHKIAGEILGLSFSRREQDHMQPIVKAEIVQDCLPSEKDSKKIQIVTSSQAVKATVCCLQ